MNEEQHPLREEAKEEFFCLRLGETPAVLGKAVLVRVGGEELRVFVRYPKECEPPIQYGAAHQYLLYAPDGSFLYVFDAFLRECPHEEEEGVELAVVGKVTIRPRKSATTLPYSLWADASPQPQADEDEDVLPLGQRACDIVTGLRGVLTERVISLTTCDRYRLTAPIREDGTLGVEAYFDKDRLEMLSDWKD